MKSSFILVRMVSFKIIGNNMLAFAKDISQTNPEHPEEPKDSKLKSYMDYQRKLDHEKLVYHSLDHAKTYLHKNIEDAKGDKKKLRAYLEKAFPVSHRFGDANCLMLMLRKLIDAHNSTNNWYRMNHYYLGLVYDCIERFVQIYNRTLAEAPEKAAEYSASEEVEVDFDDWVNLYFEDLDFMIGLEPKYVHFPFKRRNEAIKNALQQKRDGGKSLVEALTEVKKEFQMEDSAVKIFLGKEADQKDLELFFTSAENPIYEHLYDPDSEAGFMDGETLIDHSYYIGNQLKGLGEKEAENLLDQIKNLSRN